MDQRGKQGGREAKARHRIGRHGFEPARHHRIGGPYKGRDKRRDQSGYLAGRKTAADVAGEQEHRAGKAEQRADDVMRRQTLAGQHDENSTIRSGQR